MASINPDTICISCGSPNIRQKHFTQQAHYFHCTECSLEFVWPQLSKQGSKQDYTGCYSGKRVLENHEEITERALHVLSYFCDSIFKFDSNQKVSFIDIGCGGGHFVKAASTLGWKSTGTDVDSQTIAELQKLGLEVFPGELPISGLTPGSFDIVKLMHVLEHVPNPHNLISNSVTLLKKGGMIWIDVPNQSSMIAKGKKLLQKIFRSSDYGYIQPPLHLTGFNKQSLCAILEKHGCQVLQVIRSSPIDRKTYPSTQAAYSKNLKYRLYKLLYTLSWYFGDSPYISVVAKYTG